MDIKNLFYLWLIFFSTSIYAKEYTVGVENIDYYPFYSVNSRGEYVGYARDVLDLFAKKKGFKFIYEARTLKKLNEQFIKERRFDFKFPDNKFWAKEVKDTVEVFYSSPICNFVDGVIVNKKDKDKDINYFKAAGIGVVRGYSILGYENAGIVISESPDIATLIERLKYGRISGAYFNVEVALNKVNGDKNLKNKFFFNQKIPFYKSSFDLSTFNHPEIIEDFNLFLSENRDEVNKIKEKYGIKD